MPFRLGFSRCARRPAAVDAGGTDAGTATDGAATDAALTPTGEACVVSSVPMGGFDTREIYLEVSPSCGGTCMVYQLDGDPSPGCAGADCADPMEIADRVFCTCRCGGPDPSLDYCACPSTMTCVPDVVTTGGAGIVGDYCVRAGL